MAASNNWKLFWQNFKNNFNNILLFTILGRSKKIIFMRNVNFVGRNYVIVKSDRFLSFHLLHATTIIAMKEDIVNYWKKKLSNYLLIFGHQLHIKYWKIKAVTYQGQLFIEFLIALKMNNFQFLNFSTVLVNKKFLVSMNL